MAIQKQNIIYYVEYLITKLTYNNNNNSEMNKVDT